MTNQQIAAVQISSPGSINSYDEDNAQPPSQTDSPRTDRHKQNSVRVMGGEDKQDVVIDKGTLQKIFEQLKNSGAENITADDFKRLVQEWDLESLCH